MYRFIFYMLFFTAFGLNGQDKVYLLDGSSKTGKIIEISPEYIVLESAETVTIGRDKVLMLEFKNGSVELVNLAKESVVFNGGESETQRKKDIDKSLSLNNIISINTMALINSDFSVFYERLLFKKQFGVGAMGAYNINPYASFQNLFIANLSNAKKNYDLGLFANYYSDEISTETTIHMGVLFKYMNFNFTKVTEEITNNGGNTSVNIKYSPAKGSQLATIFTLGTSTPLSNKVYLKTIIGLGGFNMKGDYKKQHNYFLNKNNAKGTVYNRTFLLKIYLGINLGYNF